MKSQVLARILKEEVEVHSNDPTGVHVKFDRTPTQVRTFELFIAKNVTIFVFARFWREMSTFLG